MGPIRFYTVCVLMFFVLIVGWHYSQYRHAAKQIRDLTSQPVKMPTSWEDYEKQMLVVRDLADCIPHN